MYPSCASLPPPPGQSYTIASYTVADIARVTTGRRRLQMHVLLISFNDSFNVEPRRLQRHNPLVIRTQRDVTYKCKQQVATWPADWLIQVTSISVASFLPGRQMAPRGVHITSKFSHEPAIIVLLGQRNYHINWASERGGRGGCVRHERLFLSSRVPRFVFQSSMRL